MADSAERERLRRAGRIPQETRDYLDAKRHEDGRFRWWEIPILLAVAAEIAFLIVLLFRDRRPWTHTHSLFICVMILLLGNVLRDRIRRNVC